MRLRFWRKKKQKKVNVIEPMEYGNSLCWFFHNEVIDIPEIEIVDGAIDWSFKDKDYKAIVQTNPFIRGNSQVWFVRGIETNTFNPFLQADFEPDTFKSYKAVIEDYYRDKGIAISDDYKSVKTHRIYSSALLGRLGKDTSDQQFFNAEQMSRWTYAVIMLAGWAAIEFILQIIETVGENFG